MTNEEIQINFPGQILEYVDTHENLLKLFKYIKELEKENNRLHKIIDKYEEEKKLMY